MIRKFIALGSWSKANLIPTLNQPSKNNLITPFPEGNSIPKIIHQTFYQSSLPEELQQNVSKLKGLNPEWEYRFYNDNDVSAFVATNYPSSVFKLFNQIDDSYGAAKADLFRYLLMYKCGGFYLDIKSSASRPLDEILEQNDRYLLSHWKNGKGEEFEGWGQHKELGDSGRGEFEQWYIACAPGHPFLKSVIEAVLRNIKIYNPVLHGVGKYGVLRLTGPIAYTLAVKRVLPYGLYRMVDSQEKLGLEYSIYHFKEHVKIFKNHYSVLTIPLVRLGKIKTQTVRILETVKKIKHALSGRISGI